MSKILLLVLVLLVGESALQDMDSGTIRVHIRLFSLGDGSPPQDPSSLFSSSSLSENSYFTRRPPNPFEMFNIRPVRVWTLVPTESRNLPRSRPAPPQTPKEESLPDVGDAPSDENISNDPQEERTTGSPFDFMNDVLDQNNLNEAKKALDDPKTKELIDKYGENATIFAPNDEAFKKDPQSKEANAKDRFRDNHVVLGQRIPIYSNDPGEEETEPTIEGEEDDANKKKPSKTPKILTANIEFAGGPIIHIIDRIIRRPFDLSTMGTMQPVMRSMMTLVDMAEMKPALQGPNTFFCPVNAATRSMFPNPEQADRDQIKRFVSEHLVQGGGGCQPTMYNMNGQHMSCFEEPESIVLNGRRFPKRKVEEPNTGSVAFIIPAIVVPGPDGKPAGRTPKITFTIRYPDNDTSREPEVMVRHDREPDPFALDPNKLLKNPQEELDKLTENLKDKFLKDLGKAPKKTKDDPEEPGKDEPSSDPEQLVNDKPSNAPEEPEEDKPFSDPEEPEKDKPSDDSEEPEKDKPSDEPENPEDKPTDEPENLKDKPSDEPENPEDKPSDEPEKPEEDKPTDEPENLEDKPSDEPENLEDKPSDEPDNLEDKPSDESENPKDKPSDEAEKPEDKPTDEPEKPEEDKPSDEPENPEDKPSDEPEKPEEDKPSDETEKPEEDKPSDETEKPEEDKPSDETEKPEEDKPSDEPENPEDKPSDKPEKPEEDKQSDEPEKPEDKPSDDTKEPVKDKLSNDPEEPEKDKPNSDPEEPEKDKPSDQSEEPEDKPSDEPENLEDKPSDQPENPEDKPSDEPENPEKNKPSSKLEKPKKNKPTSKPEKPEEDKPSSGLEEPEKDKPYSDPEEPKKDKPTSKPEKPKKNKPTSKPDKPEKNKPSSKPKKPEEDKPSNDPEEPEKDEPSDESEEPEKPEGDKPYNDPKEPEDDKPSNYPEEPENDKPSSDSEEPEKDKDAPTEYLDNNASPNSNDSSTTEPTTEPTSKPTTKPSTRPPSPAKKPKSKPRTQEKPPKSKLKPNKPPPVAQPPSENESPKVYPKQAQKKPNKPRPVAQPPPEEEEPIEQQIDDTMPEMEPTNTVDYPPERIEQKPEEFINMMQTSAKKMNCARFFDWLLNSGVLDEIIRRKGNCTVFMPIDQASSKLPYNMLNMMNTKPKKMKKLMQLHTVPKPFTSIYPRQMPNYARDAPSRPPPPPRSLSNEPIRFDRSLVPNNHGQYVPLVSGCPMVDSHQIGPLRLIATGSVLFPPQPSVSSIIERSPNLKLCNEFMQASGMEPQLFDPNSPPVTIFAPTDQALSKRFSRQQLSAMIRDREACRQFINEHMVKDRAVYKNSIPIEPEEETDPNFDRREAEVQSCANTPLRIARSPQSMYMNNAHVGYSDISAHNGVVHILNDFA